MRSNVRLFMEKLNNILYSIRVEFGDVLILLHGNFNIDLLSSNNNYMRPEFKKK